MNQTLKKAIREVETLPEAEQEELGRALMKMAAQKERQKMIAQLSGVSMNRAMAPPKLQKSAERKTSRKPRRSSRRETCGVLSDVAAASVMAPLSSICG